MAGMEGIADRRSSEEMGLMDIRKKTCIIIRKNGEYLAGKQWFSDEPKWTISAYDAWSTRDGEAAEEIARKVGGVLVLFNPIVNRKKVI